MVNSLSSIDHWLVLWYCEVVLACVLALAVGYAGIEKIRQICKTTKYVWRLTLSVFAAPIAIYILCSSLAHIGVFNKTMADSFSFGFVAGIIIKINSKPTESANVKLIAQQIDGKQTEVWVESTEITIGEVRNKIAEALEISQPGRVSIESGKGCFLEDMTMPLSSLLDDSSKSTDFFGFITSTCFIHVKEEEVKPKVTFGDDVLDRERNDKKTPNPFRSLLHSRIRFGDQLNFSAKVSVSQDANSFQINIVDKFVAAAPALGIQLPNFSIRLHSWSAINAAATGDGVSETAEVTSVSSGTARRGGGFFAKRRHANEDSLGASGELIKSGDMVVIEHDGKFMSVARGWWMAWSSVEPRRSGAFVVELVEKAPQNKLKEFTEQIKGQFENIKEKMGRPSILGREALESAATDNYLRPGDLFRLRSVKFPEYELGITSVKIRDKFCYVGLRKINDGTPQHSDEQQEWCTEVFFSVKPQIVTTEMFNVKR